MNPDQLQLRDIHPPLLLPEAQDYTILLVVACLCLLLGAVALWFFRFRKMKASCPLAHEKALAEMKSARSLMSVERSREYAGEISDILRRYIEQRFSLRSTRQTSTEFFASLAATPQQTAALFEKHYETLQDCLAQCDLAKFARCSPDLASMEKMEAAVQNFIEATREPEQGRR